MKANILFVLTTRAEEVNKEIDHLGIKAREGRCSNKSEANLSLRMRHHEAKGTGDIVRSQAM